MSEFEFAQANKLIARTARGIADQFKSMIAALPDGVAADYAIEELAVELNQQHPEILWWINRQTGDASIRLSLALREWLERPSGR